MPDDIVIGARIDDSEFQAALARMRAGVQTFKGVSDFTPEQVQRGQDIAKAYQTFGVSLEEAYKRTKTARAEGGGEDVRALEAYISSLKKAEQEVIRYAQALDVLERQEAQQAAASAKMAEGGPIGRLVSEMGRGLFTVARWSIMWRSIGAVLDAVDNSFKTIGEDLQIYFQLSNRLEAGNEAASKSFAQLAQAASLSHASIADTFKRVSTLYGAGMMPDDALRSAIAIQQTQFRTGIDLTDTVAKAQMFQATAQQILAASQAGGPYARLAAPAREEMRRESIKPMVDYEMQLRQTAEARVFEDQVHDQQRLMQMQEMLANKEMTDRQRVESQAMEDIHFRINDEIEQTDRMIDREMSERHYAAEDAMQQTDMMINREMEARHRAINQEMEDRHRAASEREEDESRATSQAMERIQRVRSARELRREGQQLGFGLFGGGFTRLGVPPGMSPNEYAERVQRYKEDLAMFKLQGQAQEQEREHHAAQRGRQHETTSVSRGEQAESIAERQRQEDQAHAQRVRFHNEEVQEQQRQEDELHNTRVQFHNDEIEMSRRHQQERETTEWNFATKRMSFEDDVYNHQKELERKYQDFKLDEEGKALNARFKLNMDFLRSHEEDIQKNPQNYPTGAWNWLTGTTFGMQQTPIAPKPGESTTDGLLKDTNGKLESIEKLLNQVLQTN